MENFTDASVANFEDEDDFDVGFIEALDSLCNSTSDESAKTYDESRKGKVTGYNVFFRLIALKAKKKKGEVTFGQISFIAAQMWDKTDQMTRRKFHEKALKLNSSIDAIILQFDCKVCGKSFKKRKYLNFHEKEHLETFSCKICQKGFNSSQLLQCHTKETHMEKSFVCKTCGKSFSRLYRLTEHVKVHSYNSIQKKCDKCNNQFSTVSNLNKHKKKYH